MHPSRTSYLVGVLLVGVTALGACVEDNPNSCVNSPCAAPMTCDQSLGVCVMPGVPGGEDAGVEPGQQDGAISMVPKDAATEADAAPQVGREDGAAGDAPRASTDAAATVDAADALPMVDAAPVTVVLRSPQATTYTNGNVSIEVAVTGAPETVELLLGETRLVALTPPYKYTWDTTALAEGSYQISARATRGVESPRTTPITVIVDRTAPTAVQLTPGAGSDNVFLGDDIVLQASERLAPSTVSGASVTLSAGGAAIGTSVQLSTDGKTITVKLADRASVTVPSAATASVAGVTDLAGNPLTVKNWTWTYPAWVDWGIFDGFSPHLVRTDDGSVFASWLTGSAGAFSLHAAAYAGGKSWTEYPRQDGLSTVWSALAVGPTPPGPWAAWTSGATIQLGRITTDGTWDLKLPLTPDASGSGTPVLTITSLDFGVGADGIPHVGWSDQLQDGSGLHPETVHLGRLVGASWGMPCGTMGPGTSVRLKVFGAWPVIGWTFTGDPTVHLGLCRSGIFTETPTFTNSGAVFTPPSFALDAAGDPYPVSRDVTRGLVVSRQMDGGWADLVDVLKPGNLLSTGRQQVVLHDGLVPIVGWTEIFGGNRVVRIASWRNNNWDQSYAPLGTNAGQFALIAGTSGEPILAWEETGGKILVWRGQR